MPGRATAKFEIASSHTALSIGLCLRLRPVHRIARVLTNYSETTRASLRGAMGSAAEEPTGCGLSLLEGTGFELPVRGRGQSGCRPFFCRRKLGRGRCALSVFGQHYALHQSGVDPTAEAAIRAGDAQRQILAWSGKKTETLYRVTAPADPVLVHGNRLCRAKWPQPVPFMR